MRNKLITLILLLGVGLGACFAQNKTTRKPGSFHEIRVGQAIDVFLKAGSSESVEIHSEGVELDKIKTEVSGGKLKIYLSGNNRWFRKTSVKIYVTYKTLKAISVSSAADVVSESPIKEENLDVSVSSAGSLRLDVDVNHLTVAVSSSGDVNLSGKAGVLIASASSAGDIEAFELECQTAEAKASSAGDIEINVKKEINARASSGGSVRYRGNPTRSNTDSSSGGSVRKY